MFNPFEYFIERMEKAATIVGHSESSIIMATVNIFQALGEKSFNKIYESTVDYVKSWDWVKTFDNFHQGVGNSFHKNFRQADIFWDIENHEGESISGYLDMVAWNLISGGKTFWTVFAEVNWIKSELLKNPEADVDKLKKRAWLKVEEYFEEQKETA